jgi:sulfate adenylyltransferase subunit 1
MGAHPAPASFVPEGLLATGERRDLLRFITCGSVDDGKSTLIGRLLFDSKHLFDDQLSALERDSIKLGTQDGKLDLALALDGLAAEREQGITIDVAYRFFSTEARGFIVADTPGHEQYTRNMATGASTADLAILLVDARKGLTRQTRRHSLLVSMLGIRQVVVAINKMDLVGWSQEVFENLMAEYRAFAGELGFHGVVGIPMSALDGGNVTRAAEETPWYRGPTLLQHLETVEVERDGEDGPFRMPIQWVNRPNLDFRGFAGFVTGGSIRPGQRVRVLPSGEETRVARIVTYDGDLDRAVAGQSVTLTLADEVDASRGSVIVAADAPGHLTDRIDARLFWMVKPPLREGARYIARLGTQKVHATVETVRSRVDLHTLENEPVSALEINDTGEVTLVFDRPVAWDAYAENRDSGSLILIDRETYDTVAMGLALEKVAALAHVASGSTDETAAPAWLARPLETVWRSALKTISWRITGTLLTLLAAYMLTGNLTVALSVGAVDMSVKLLLFFGHERLWARIGLGLEPGPAFGPGDLQGAERR